MSKTDKEILTTADTAKLLGVSVRTAQLLIEGGSITSWKTPGGHRRVYRSDVLSLIDDRPAAVAPLPSATVFVLGTAERLALYDRLFATVPECTVDTFEDVLEALVAVGSVKPHTIIVDLGGSGTDRLPLLRSLATSPATDGTQIMVVGDDGLVPRDLLPKLACAATPEDAVSAVRATLSDTEELKVTLSDQTFPIALNEGRRLVALERSGLVDSAPEEAFDRLTWLAAHGLKAPVALMTLLTPTRQWFKSRFGLDLPETPRSWAFCNHTVMQKGVFSVEDLATDPRFADNPAVKGEPRFRFYAGAPVLDEDGFVVGSLCVIDHKARTLSDHEAQTISALAALASDEVRLRALDRKLREASRRHPERAAAAGAGAGTAANETAAIPLRPTKAARRGGSGKTKTSGA
ncbi:GAF domain-containing protein [Sphingosinicella sp. BN140058]|uniref:GAF domain-containing protein n=1 Tax=Sphingosinicella sp. BN140058 TaxID=1892855 RepID=UPI001011E91E|nr:GAF domain-containing protein [Sphingosinicella sp. BN140058]QAY76341.1 GAF domain-containing protein [Sphingosinicella sp. BN140058]